MDTICWMVRFAGAWDATLPDLTMISVSTANGKDCRPSAVSPALCADDERAKSMRGSLVAPWSRFFPAPEPTGRLISAPEGIGSVPPPVADHDTSLAAGGVPWVLKALARARTTPWVVSEPTPMRSPSTPGWYVVSSG